jgi:hypothetical protein
VTVPFGHNVDQELRDARARAPHRIYFAGKQVEGFPLTGVELLAQRPAHASFMYGTCNIELPADGGCSVPIQIQNFPFRAADWGRAVGCTRRGTYRGVPGVHMDALTLFTRDTIVKVYAPTAAQTRRVVAALRPLDSADGRLLPAPPPGQMQLVESVCLATPRGGLARFAVDDQRGRFGFGREAVGIGSTRAEVRAQFGNPRATEGFLPLEPPGVHGPYAFSVPGNARPSVMRYERVAFVLANDRVFGFITSDPRAFLTRGGRVGGPLGRVRKAYTLACRQAPAGEGNGTYTLCRTRLPNGLQLVVTKDPVESIALLR